MNKRILIVLLATAFGGAASAKLPAPDDATKAKAAETAAKAAWQGKIDAWQLCRVQDRIAAKFGGKGAIKPVSMTAAAAPVAAASKPAAAASKPAAAASGPVGTPVAGVPATACADPGPFAYNAPAEKPLETSGAHSPAGNATSPPSVKQDSATMAPAKK